MNGNAGKLTFAQKTLLKEIDSVIESVKSDYESKKIIDGKDFFV